MRDEPLSDIVVTESLAMNWNKTGAVIWISGKYIGNIFRINSNQKIYIGRDYGQVDFVLEDADVSRIHCWIEYNAAQDGYLFCDVSKNGIIINGTKSAKKNQVIFLNTGDEVRIAKTNHIFKLG